VRLALVVAALTLALLASVVLAVLVGAVALSPDDVVRALFGAADPTTNAIVRDLRLPRVIAAALVGGALAVAGVLLQGLLRNPLADPYVTGTSAGASLGAVGALALGAAAYPVLVPIAAAIGALVAAFTTWRLAALGGRATVLTVLLGGVVLTSFAGAVTTFLLVASDRITPRLRSVLGWLLGGVSVLDVAELMLAAVIVIIGVALAIIVAPRLDAFALGEETATTLGVDVGRTSSLILALAACLTAAAVAVAGVIGFVGLVVPHALRPIAGAVHRRLVPAAFLAGACVLVLADAGARTVLSPSELPVGVITGALGGPFFLVLLVRSRRRMVV
jgi:iron complex transport system permease protein